MARGLPDWDSQVRLFAGTPTRLRLNHSFAGIGDHEFTLIEGKGMILGGHLDHLVGSSHTACNVILSIDGVEAASSTFGDMLTLFGRDMPGYPLILTYFDDIVFDYVVQFKRGWIFDESIQVTINEKVGAGDWDGWLFYTLLG